MIQGYTDFLKKSVVQVTWFWFSPVCVGLQPNPPWLSLGAPKFWECLSGFSCAFRNNVTHRISLLVTAQFYWTLWKSLSRTQSITFMVSLELCSFLQLHWAWQFPLVLTSSPQAVVVCGRAGDSGYLFVGLCFVRGSPKGDAMPAAWYRS